MAWLRLSFVLVAGAVLYTLDISAQESEVPSKGGTIRGHIFDTTPQELPIGGVQVTILARLAHGREFKTTTNANGEYKFTDLPTGFYEMFLSKEGYHYHDLVGHDFLRRYRGRLIGVGGTDLSESGISRIFRNRLQIGEGMTRYLPLTMTKREDIFTAALRFLGFHPHQVGTLRLNMIGSLSTDPTIIDDVDAKIFGTDLTGTLNAKGPYRFDNVPPGNYVVALNINGYHTAFPMIIRHNQITEYDVRYGAEETSLGIIISRRGVYEILMGQAADKLRASGTIYGTIRAPNVKGYAMAVDCAHVTIVSETGEKYQCTSNAYGEYEYTGLPAGRYLINLRKKGYTDIKGIPVTIPKDGNNVRNHVNVSQECLFGEYVVHRIRTDGSFLRLEHGMTQKENFFTFVLQFEGGIWLIVFLSLITLTLLIVLTVLLRRIFFKRETSES